MKTGVKEALLATILPTPMTAEAAALAKQIIRDYYASQGYEPLKNLEKLKIAQLQAYAAACLHMDPEPRFARLDGHILHLSTKQYVELPNKYFQPSPRNAGTQVPVKEVFSGRAIHETYRMKGPLFLGSLLSLIVGAIVLAATASVILPMALPMLSAALTTVIALGAGVLAFLACLAVVWTMTPLGTKFLLKTSQNDSELVVAPKVRDGNRTYVAPVPAPECERLSKPPSNPVFAGYKPACAGNTGASIGAIARLPDGPEPRPQTSVFTRFARA